MGELARLPQQSDLDLVKDIGDLERLGKILAASGYFSDARETSQCIVKILAGKELGIPTISALVGIYIVKGKPTLSANLMAAAVKRSGKYNYRVLQHTSDICEIAFFEGRDEIELSTFTREDARLAGTQNMDKYSRNMLFARAMSNGCRWHCPDVFLGPVYTPEELGVIVDSEGNVVEAELIPIF